MSTTVLDIREIVSNPNVRNGRPIIAGTGIRVSDIVAWHLYGDKLSAEKIASDFRLSLGQVHAALAYYYLHQEAVDEEMRESAAEAERLIADLTRQGKASALDGD